jgi:hypothetical protein
MRALHPCRIRQTLLLATATLTFLGESSAFANWGGDIALEPITYFGPRSEEPLQQGIAVFQLKRSRAETGFFLNARAQLELLGDRNINADLNRVGYLSRETWGRVTLGRIHPWETRAMTQNDDGMSRLSAAYGPWSLNGQTQAQNLGLELGFPDAASAFRQPVLAGWLGIHVEIPESATLPVSFSASASPFFLPTIGSQVRFSTSEATRIGRFGRTPPATVLVNDVELPLYYQVNTDRMLDDILLQPQFMIQAFYQSRLENGARFSSHFWLQRAPQPDPTASASGTLQVSESAVSALAEITPAFPQRWTLGFTESYSSPAHRIEAHFSANAAAGNRAGSLPFGAEVGLRWSTLSASLLHRFAEESATSAQGISANPNSAYERMLLQLQWLDYWSESLSFGAGTQWHLNSPDSVRIAAQLTYQPLSSPWLLQFNAELFGGNTGTWFGEWRTNDRIALNLQFSL